MASCLQMSAMRKERQARCLIGEQNTKVGVCFEPLYLLTQVTQFT